MEHRMHSWVDINLDVVQSITGQVPDGRDYPQCGLDLVRYELQQTDDVIDTHDVTVVVHTDVDPSTAGVGESRHVPKILVSPGAFELGAVILYHGGYTSRPGLYHGQLLSSDVRC